MYETRDKEGKFTRAMFKQLFSLKTGKLFFIGTLIFTFSATALLYGTILPLIQRFSPELRITYVNHANAEFEQSVSLKVVDLSHLGKMGKEIELASKEFNVPVELILGIANAESSMGTNFVHPYDHNCFNAWGLRKIREDGSYLRCFNDWKAGARTTAKLLKDYYIDQGFNTPEKICQKWVGSTYAEKNCPAWIKNVSVYYK